MNTTTKPFLTRCAEGFRILDGDDELHLTFPSFAEARRVLAGLHADGMSVVEYLDRINGLYDYDEPHEATCWVCDSYHHGRGCPIDADDRYDDYSDDTFGY